LQEDFAAGGFGPRAMIVLFLFLVLGSVRRCPANEAPGFENENENDYENENEYGVRGRDGTKCGLSRDSARLEAHSVASAVAGRPRRAVKTTVVP